MSHPKLQRVVEFDNYYRLKGIIMIKDILFFKTNVVTFN